MRLTGSIWLLFIVVLASSCSKSVIDVLKTTQPINAEAIESGKPLAIIFLDVDCPISQYAAKPFKQLSEDHGEQISFIGIIPGDYYSDEKIDSFSTVLNLKYGLVQDEKNKLVRALNASITPEVFLLDVTGNVLYQGALDDKYKALGRARHEVSENYLERAISAHLLGRPIEVNKTNAIGCKIEL